MSTRPERQGLFSIETSTLSPPFVVCELRFFKNKKNLKKKKAQNTKRQDPPARGIAPSITPASQPAWTPAVSALNQASFQQQWPMVTAWPGQGTEALFAQPLLLLFYCPVSLELSSGHAWLLGPFPPAPLRGVPDVGQEHSTCHP